MAKVLHASASGYFPSCLFEDASLATQSLADVMEIYWKVKSWTITITSAEFSISPRTFTQTAPDETYLVCDNIGATGNGFSPSDEYGFFFLNGFYVNSYASPTLYGVTPNFSVRQDEFPFAEFSSGGVVDFEREVGTFSFFGQSFPLYRISEDQPEQPAASGVIEPASYWTYEE